MLGFEQRRSQVLVRNYEIPVASIVNSSSWHRVEVRVRRQPIGGLVILFFD
jgi:hypothetical protein